MERDRQGEAVWELEGAWAGEAEDGDGWAELEREQDLAGIASAPVAERLFRIRWELPATT
jgi:hypothetical protein